MSKVKMKKIALTGMIGAGKSAVMNILDDIGIKVFSCDEINAQLLKKNEPGYEALKAILSKEMFDESQNINHKKLAKLFSDYELKKQVESILHPLIIKEIEKKFLLNRMDKCIVVEVPLLFETAMQSMFDECWVVVSNKNRRLARLLKNRGISNKEANRRMAFQMSEEDKIKLSDKVIDNNGTLTQLKEQICDILKERI